MTSKKWVQKHLQDPYVKEAQRQGYRSRAAFKLIELNKTHHFLKPGEVVVDLGAAPGGWSQIAKQQVGEHGRVVAIDRLEMEGIPGVEWVQGDFTEDETYLALKDLVPNGANVVISDMAPDLTGVKHVDQVRSLALVELAYDFAKEVLQPGGVFLAKVFQSVDVSKLRSSMMGAFKEIKFIKPKSSRKESSEIYLLALQFGL